MCPSAAYPFPSGCDEHVGGSISASGRPIAHTARRSLIQPFQRPTWRNGEVMPACRHLRATSASGSSGARRQVEPKKTRRSFRWAVPVGLGAVLAFIPAPAQASKCPSDTIFNPITKVRWNCIFPITIGGVRAGSYDKLDKALDAQSASKPLCACRKGATFWFGVKVSFWTPNRMIDVVTEPGCMMALGTDIMATGGKLQGSQSSISDGTNTTKLFAQMHYYVAPVWKMLDMFSDLPCLEDDGFDVALMTEVMPTWQSLMRISYAVCCMKTKKQKN